jgi:glutathione S-transferase
MRRFGPARLTCLVTVCSSVQAHIDKVGAKLTPVLEFEKGKYMKESMDIVDYLDGKPTLATHDVLVSPWLALRPVSVRLSAAEARADGETGRRASDASDPSLPVL